MASRADVVKALAILGAAYPGHKVSEATTAVYAEMLADVDGGLLLAAAKQCTARCRFFPSIAELREAALTLAGPTLPSAYEAWGEVVAGMRTHPPTRRPEFTHPLVLQAVQWVGGWWGLCMSQNGAADRARFIEAYDAFAARVAEDAKTPETVKETVRRITTRRAERCQRISGNGLNGLEGRALTDGGRMEDEDGAGDEL